jgi:hypothetical protein
MTGKKTRMPLIDIRIAIPKTNTLSALKAFFIRTSKKEIVTR